ncbi:MAG: VgrG-related protein [Anaerolineae bacterium]|nr:VgrG-related protein [Anaerolineae bacterium]
MSSTHFTQPLLKINGSPVSTAFARDLIEVVVDSSLHLPSLFTVVLDDPELTWVDDSLLSIGAQVEISITTGKDQGGLSGTLIKGEITALEPHFAAQGTEHLSTLAIRGYDKSHRLHRGKRTRTFLKQKDSGIVQTIAGEAGLSAEVDQTTVTYDYVLQNNQTNMEFLISRAERIGYQVSVSEGKLCFRRGDYSRGDGPDLRLGEQLRDFRPCWSATHQADKVLVQGWDTTTKKAITTTVTPTASLNQGGMLKTGADIAKDAFQSAEAVVTDHPVLTVDEAKELATGLNNDIGREFVEAEGTCDGDPRILAGWKVNIVGVGQRFSGKYWVTSATHTYNEEGYTTSFSITGRHPNTLSYLLDSGNGHDPARGMMRGVVTALVTNLDDPDDLGRVKVKYAWLGEIESHWVRVAAPMAGAQRGFYYLPEINDEVLVAFEHGDPHYPVIIGSLWNGTDKPPKPNSAVVQGGVVNERIIQSRSGHVVILDDTNGSEKIIIRDKTEKNEIIISSSDNSMAINVEGDFTVTAKGKITLTSTLDMALESKANSKINAGANLNVEATGSSTVKGVQLTLEGTGKSELKAPMVSVNGNAMVEVKGALVKIN